MSVPFKKVQKYVRINLIKLFVIFNCKCFHWGDKWRLCVCDYGDEKWFRLVLLAHRLYRTQSIQIAVEIPPTRIVIDKTIEANSPEPCLIFGARCAGTPNFVSSTKGIEGWISCMLICSMILNFILNYYKNVYLNNYTLKNVLI